MIPLETYLSDNIITLRPMWLTNPTELVEAVRESIPEIMPWMGWCTPEYDEQTASEWLETLQPAWEDGTLYAFSIVNSKDHSFLGGISLSHINRFYRYCNVGYWVRIFETGKGIASRAAKMACLFGFERIGLVRTEIVVGVENEPSLRVAEKIGATREGILRNRLVIREKFIDAVMHSLIPQDFGFQV